MYETPSVLFELSERYWNQQLNSICTYHDFFYNVELSKIERAIYILRHKLLECHVT